MKKIVEALKYCENCEFGQDRNKCGKDFLGYSKCKFPDDFFKLKDGLFTELLEADKNIKIVRAVQKAFEKGNAVITIYTDDTDEILSESELLEWDEKEETK